MAVTFFKLDKIKSFRLNLEKEWYVRFCQQNIFWFAVRFHKSGRLIQKYYSSKKA